MYEVPNRGDRVNLGQRIRKRRKDLKLTGLELGEAIGVTAQYISLIEIGNTIPSLDMLIKLAKQLGSSIDFLIGGKEGIITNTISAIKADGELDIKAKKALINLVEELRKRNTTTRENQ